MRDDSQSVFDMSDERNRWSPSWTGLVQKQPGVTDETVSALLLLVLAATEDHEQAAPASMRIVNLLSEMECHPAGSPSENALRACVIGRLSAAINGLRETLD